jgi:hypothetical protein
MLPYVSTIAVAAALTGAEPPARVPFEVGELAVYEVKFGSIRAGTGRMEVLGRDTIRGKDVLHARFSLNGGVPLFRVKDRFESWFDATTLASYRFHQQIDEGRYEKERRFEIHPELGYYIENEKDTAETSAIPLDDASFLYFIRTVPLEVGQSYSFDRYFKPDRNPVTVRVLRRERVKVPAGEFDTVVLQPVIKSRGIFSDKGQAELWISDDERRVMVQMKSKLSFGSIKLYLKSYRAGGEGAEVATQ